MVELGGGDGRGGGSATSSELAARVQLAASVDARTHIGAAGLVCWAISRGGTLAIVDGSASSICVPVLTAVDVATSHRATQAHHL